MPGRLFVVFIDTISLPWKVCHLANVIRENQVGGFFSLYDVPYESGKLWNMINEQENWYKRYDHQANQNKWLGNVTVPNDSYHFWAVLHLHSLCFISNGL